ncbi:hypothetical protein LGK98_01715 [Clostridium tagluense]|uniref:hypothetical protein n=1 Tax=Clostridium tagluense TaxID=360422 RepID=UPI001CF538A9|nr:hypothetical protein [Clostridium tagluense]MCB2319534.1 hypothetical protein [Clostridium tagluense]MCB2334083.1 hypothetical protein [Clostridium tagluense]
MKKYYVNKDILWVGKVDNREVVFHKFILNKGALIIVIYQLIKAHDFHELLFKVIY